MTSALVQRQSLCPLKYSLIHVTSAGIAENSLIYAEFFSVGQGSGAAKQPPKQTARSLLR